MCRGNRPENLRTALIDAHLALGEVMKFLEEEMAKENSVKAEHGANGVMLTLKEAAQVLRISTATLRKRYKDGQAPFVFRDGPRTLKVAKYSLDCWVKNYTQGG